MMINNIAELDQEILLLEEQELSKRNELIDHVITPAATFHTLAGLFMTWLRARDNHKEKDSPFSFLKFASGLLLPVGLLGTVWKQTGYVLKSIGFAISQITAHYVSKQSAGTVLHLFRSFLGKENR